MRPHTSGAAAVADSGDKVPGSGHLDIVSSVYTPHSNSLPRGAIL